MSVVEGVATASGNADDGYSQYTLQSGRAAAHTQNQLHENFQGSENFKALRFWSLEL